MINSHERIVMVIVLVIVTLFTMSQCSESHAGPLMPADHSTLTVEAKNGYYWDVEVNNGEPQRIQAIRDKETNIGKLEFDVKDLLTQPGEHTIRITVYNYYGTTARVFPVVTFNVFYNGTFTYRNSPLYLGIKFKRITDLRTKEE
ncbi:hypothetical protein DRN34_02235 [Thermococci archaeon]|nr:MAG: hypothetical protein DRN34_02235 [Thermococci archaeon]